MKESIKEYYQLEVDAKVVPEFRYRKGRVKPWENILIAAITLSAIVILSLPGTYRNPLRTLTISKSAEQKVETDFSKIIESLNSFYAEKRSIYE